MTRVSRLFDRILMSRDLRILAVMVAGIAVFGVVDGSMWRGLLPPLWHTGRRFCSDSHWCSDGGDSRGASSFFSFRFGPFWDGEALSLSRRCFYSRTRSGW